MKKIVGIMAVAAMATSMFAANFSATVKMDASLAKKNGDNVDILSLDKKDQKDSDALIVSGAGDKAGGKFQFWYNYAGSAADAPSIRGTNLWFKPVDMLKVTVGDVSVGGYCEHIHWWQAPTGASLVEGTYWKSRYSSYAAVEGSGAVLELTPVNGLYIAAGVAPGAGNSTASFGKTNTNAAYGATIKYSNIAGLPLSAAVAWRDAGKDNMKILAIGADYGNEWGGPFYGFVNARLNFDKKCTKADWSTYEFDAESPLTLRGIAIDNYFKFSSGAFVAAATVPVVIRTANTKEDPSYLMYDVKVQYAVGALTPYVEVDNKDGTYNPIAFAGESDFGIRVKPGVALSVGACGIDLGVNVVITGKTNTQVTWSVPVAMQIGL